MKAVPLGKINSIKIGIIVFVGLIIFNLPCLTNPPYWDDILGLHNQAVWLAKNNFDVLTLWGKGQSYLEGGSYLYRLMPYPYGVMYALLPVGVVHLIGHVFNIACLAAAAALFYMAIRRHVRHGAAVLWTAAAFCEPVMSGQSASLGQECPLVLISALTILLVERRRLWWALAIASTAVLIKATAVILVLAILTWLLVLAVLSLSGVGNIRLSRGWGWLCLTAFIIASLVICDLCFGVLSEGNAGSMTAAAIFRRGKFIFGELLPLQGAALFLMAIASFTIARRLLGGRMSPSSILSGFLAIATAGFWCAFLIYPVPLPRYTCFIVLPMFAFLAINFHGRVLNLTVSGLFLALGLLLANGLLLPPLPPSVLSSGEYLERSREYLDDLEAEMVLCETLEAGNRPVVAKWPMVQMLTMPEMGYVDKPLTDVFCAGVVPKYAPVKPYVTDMEMPADSIYLWMADSFDSWRAFGPSLAPGRDAVILWMDNPESPSMVIYEKPAGK